MQSLISTITVFQANPHIFYNPHMEKDPRIGQFRCLNAELAILHFETNTVACLVGRAIRTNESARVDLLPLVENSYGEYHAKTLLVKNAGQQLATEMVEVLKKSKEIWEQKKRLNALRWSFGRELDRARQKNGHIRCFPSIGLPAAADRPYNANSLPLAAEYCRLAIVTHPKRRQDLEYNHLCNLELDSSEEALDRRLYGTILLYNRLIEEEALEKLAADKEKAANGSGKKGKKAAPPSGSSSSSIKK